MMRILLTIAAALLCALPAAAQGRGFTLDEVEELLRNEVASDRVLLLVQQRCIHFVPSQEALARVAAAGGSQALVAGLRAPGLCSTLAPGPAPAAKPAPASKPASAARPVQAAKPDSARELGANSSFLFAYIQNTLHPRGAAPNLVGNGGLLEITGADGLLGAYVRLEILDLSSPAGHSLTRGAYAGGLRLFPVPARWPVRPYLDGGVLYNEISYFDDEGETERTVTGWSWEGGGGVLVRIRGIASLSVAHRLRRDALTREHWDVDPPPGHEFIPWRGTGTVWVAGLSLGP